MSKEKEQIGIINEVGDLGLGFTELKEDEKRIIKEKTENMPSK